MKRWSLIVLALLCSYLLDNAWSDAWADEDGSVVITAPADGAVVQAPLIEVTFEVVKGRRGDHVHLYVDGNFEAIVKDDRYVLKGLPPGEHQLDVKLATRRHEVLAPAATLRITVE